MLKRLYNCIYKVQVRQVKKCQQLCSLQNYSTTDRANVNDNKPNLNSFAKNCNHILQIANTSDKDELTQYIDPLHAEILISHREANGHYNSLPDLLLIDGLESGVINKFCTSITNDRKKVQSKTLTVPRITKIIPETVLGLHVGHKIVSWALVHKNNELLKWDCNAWTNDKKTNSFTMINLAASIANKLPLSNVYAMEDVVLAKKLMANIVLQKQQLLSIAIMSCIAAKNDEITSDKNVYIFKSGSTARLFNLVLGGEVLCVKQILKMEGDKFVLKNNEKLLEIEIKCDINKIYTEQKPIETEEMNWSLLKALAIFQLYKHKNN